MMCAFGKPTGMPVEMSGVNVDRVVGGLIVEHGGAANLLEPLMKIGAIRVARPTPSPMLEGIDHVALAVRH